MDSFQVLTIMNSGISFIMGFYMLFLHRNTSCDGPGYWAAGSLVIGFGLLLSVFSSVENFLKIDGYPLFTTIGLYLYLAGIWKFKGKKINKWIVMGIPILDILQSIIFVRIIPLHQIHSGLHILFLIIYCIFGTVEMLRLDATQNYLKKLFRLNAFAFTITLILLLLNVYVLITNPNIEPFKTTEIVILGQITTGFVMIALTFGFLSAVNIRLNMELNNQIKSKTKFLSIIGHDLRGPIGNISNFLELLQNNSDLTDKERIDYFSALNKLSESTYHLLQNLMEWATQSKDLNKFESTRIELSQIIYNDIELFKSSTALKSISLEINKGEQTFFMGNANMIQTIVRNLVSNAVKFTPMGGTITIKTERVLNKTRLIVSDTGQGIKPEIIDSLFKFETNNSTIGTNGEVGSGLGLVLCKDLTYRNNGTIKIESQVGIGTKVIVEFPAAK